MRIGRGGAPHPATTTDTWPEHSAVADDLETGAVVRLQDLYWCRERADVLIFGLAAARAGGAWERVSRLADRLAAVGIVAALALAERDGDQLAIARLEREARARRRAA